MQFQKKLTAKDRIVPPKQGTFIRGIAVCGAKNLRLDFSHYYPQSLRNLHLKQFDSARCANNPVLVKQYSDLVTLRDVGLKPENYHKWFKVQIHLEEVQREIDLCYSHRYKVLLKKNTLNGFGDMNTLFMLEVPGLLEKRPNIMITDSVFIRNHNEAKPIYEGIVHRIKDETIFFALDSGFEKKFKDTNLYDVQFWYNRQTFVRTHRALKYSELIPHILFPTKPKAPPGEKYRHIKFYDIHVSQNQEQSQAVKAILNEVSAPAPYIIFGPPGTGKTVTLVEAIKQVFMHNSKCRLLVCGSSNSSCDLLTERLLTDISKKDIIRFNARSRQISTASDQVKSVSQVVNNELLPISTEILNTYRIVVCTFVSAYNVIPLLREGVHASGYTHVFLDECGHGQEPEALIPLLSLARMVVLAGDPRQLGPVVSNRMCRSSDSTFFKNNGLDQSLLERLMKLSIYSADSEGQYNPQLITKLINNFRSHEGILHSPNKLFYDSQLKVCGNKTVINSLLSWKGLLNKNIPLIFDGVNGRDTREIYNPSFFNVYEANKVVHYIERLHSELKLDPKKIGVVAPYKAQIRKVSLMLRFESFYGFLVCRTLYLNIIE